MRAIESLQASHSETIRRGLTTAWIACALSLAAATTLAAVFGTRGWSAAMAEYIPAVIAVALVLSFVAEYVDGSIGMGYGTTLTAMLLILGFDAKVVVPAIVIQQLVAGLLVAGGHQAFGNADFRWGTRATNLALLLGAAGVLGGWVAATVASGLESATIKLITGAVVLAMGPLVLFCSRLRLAFSWTRAGVLGLIAAANKGLMGGGYGPLITCGQVVAGVGPREAVAVTALAEFFTCAGAVAGYTIAGATPISWPLVIGLVAGGVLAAPLAAATVRVIAPAKLKTALGLGAVFLGGLTLLRALL